MSSATCKARQHSDQMVCGTCGIGWDMNDQDPPECQQGKVAKQQLTAMRVILQEPTRFASVQRRLLKLQEMPLRWLPMANIEPGLYTVRWDSLPDAVFVMVDVVESALGNGRDYKFFNERGRMMLEVKRRDSGQIFLYRFKDGSWTDE